jgi:hypothetical protein
MESIVMNQSKRTESVIFSELSELCISPGYLHAIACLCFRDNTIHYGDVMTPKDVLEQFRMDRLIKTEISTLIGLACKGDLNAEMQTPETIQSYIDKTDVFLKEIHHSMMPDIRELFDPEQASNPSFNPFKNGATLRESIFYGGESAYHFQYRDLSSLKYSGDNDWLICNKGFSSEDCISIIAAIEELQNRKINEFITSLDINNASRWTVLDAYKFTDEEVLKESGIDLGIVNSVIEAFVSPIGMNDFSSLDDFNPKNAYPIIKIADAEYLLFQNYSLVEALYETPFFWFWKDKKYKSTAMKNRGDFTESFSAQRLTRVFGDKNVFLNVKIIDSKRKIAGEIDVLIIYANRAIILQAKSKKLTIPSRKGNDLSLEIDFKKAVQAAYDQAYSCANLITDLSYRLIDDSGNELKIERNLCEIYPFCVVSDHYPALSFQARQFLTFSKTAVIKPPFVMDVFFLDVATEMLETPLYFLSYINRRTDYNDKILSSHELTILSYHLKQNLWVDGESTMMYLEDDICADLDLAMLVRRCDVPGERTPEGILSKFKNTTFGRLITQIEKQADPGNIDFGFMLLLLNEDTINQLNTGIDHIAKLALTNHNCHDLTIAIGMGTTGLTIHCNADPTEVAWRKLERHAEIRKYGQKAKEWFGICIDPETMKLRFGLKLLYEWEQSFELDGILGDLPKAQRKINIGTEIKGRKIGRNEMCLCGSGVKYKKCCLK